MVYGVCFNNVLKRTSLAVEATALQADDAIGQGILLALTDVLAYYLHQVGKGHHGTRHHEVVQSVLVLATQMARLAVLQSDGLAHFLGHPNLLARSVNELERYFREQDGQRYARKAPACTEVEHTGARLELNEPPYGQRVEHMVQIETVDVLTRNDVNLRVPLAVERIEGVKLFSLTLRKARKILVNQLHGYSFFKISSKST